MRTTEKFTAVNIMWPLLNSNLNDRITASTLLLLLPPPPPPLVPTPIPPCRIKARAKKICGLTQSQTLQSGPTAYNVRRPLNKQSSEEFVLGVESDKEISMTGSTPETNSSQLRSLSGRLTLYRADGVDVAPEMERN